MIARKGWCPGALRPMPAGDGLLLRLRPRVSMLSQTQVAGVARLAKAFGNGAIDLGSRASLQLRGILPDRLEQLQTELGALDLIDDDPALEARRNIITSPLWGPGDSTTTLYALVEKVLRHAPELPAKFGFAIDTGQVACLQSASADLRLELNDQDLILRAEGMQEGEVTPKAQLAEKMLEVLNWFALTGCRRMSQALAEGHRPPIKPMLPPRHQACLSTQFASRPFVFAPFGASSAEAFAELAGSGLRLTPWRAVLPDQPPSQPKLWLTDANHHSLRVDACPGLAGCAAASVETRLLAARLAPRLRPDQRLHVSGCAKGCARAGTADLTLVGHDGRFDLILRGKPGDPPVLRDLSPDNLSSSLGDLLAPPL